MGPVRRVCSGLGGSAVGSEGRARVGFGAPPATL